MMPTIALAEEAVALTFYHGDLTFIEEWSIPDLGSKAET